jgi:ABC-type uncharacterized transport system substrate-binding protein
MCVIKHCLLVALITNAPFRRLTGVLQRLVTAALCASAIASPSVAHPHVWVIVDATVVIEAGSFTGLRYIWRFDKAYRDQLLEQFDTDKDGALSDAELKTWLDLSVKTLREQKLFTTARIGKQKLVLTAPSAASVTRHGDGLQLEFIAKVTPPVSIAGRTLEIDIYDPTFFSGFDYASDRPVAVAAIPAMSCQATVALNPEGEQQKVINAFMKVFGRIDAKVPPAKTLTVACKD